MTRIQKNTRLAFLLFVFVFLLAAGCGDNESANAVKKPPVDYKTGAHNTLRIVFNGTVMTLLLRRIWQSGTKLGISSEKEAWAR